MSLGWSDKGTSWTHRPMAHRPASGASSLFSYSWLDDGSGKLGFAVCKPCSQFAQLESKLAKMHHFSKAPWKFRGILTSEVVSICVCSEPLASPTTHGPLLRTPKGHPECHSVHRQFQRSALKRQQRNVKENEFKSV